MQPYTDQLLKQWAGEGIRRVDVLCPGFSIDCLETIDEIAGENAEAFVHAGGERLSYIPALNASPAHAAMLASLVERHIAGWAPPAEAAGDARLARVAAIRAAQAWTGETPQ